MAGRKMERELMKEIEKRGSEQYVLEFIGDGGSVKALADDLGCSRSYLSNCLNKRPEYRAALEEGRRMQADTLAEQSMAIVDDMAMKGEYKSEDVALARERIAVRKWLAALNNPDRFAPKDKGVTINVANLHLDALKKVTAELKDVTPKAQEIEYDSGDE
jgi:AraC-like DNA-binding protein